MSAAPPPDLPPSSPPSANAGDTPAVPFEYDELSVAATLRRPHRMLDIVLGERRRLAANMERGFELRALLATLLTCSVLAAVPFALVDGLERIAHVAMLFLGSVLLCYPSLQVFGSYLGIALHPAQYLTIALVIPAAAALFTLGFAPIYWFLSLTMPGATSGAAAMPSSAVRITLLVLAMALALSHINRLLLRDVRLAPLQQNMALWIGWQVLLVFLTWRMADTLGLI
ncbi:MAG: hypothetical protein AB8H80_00835 [Planctomycetota bacterium]